MCCHCIKSMFAHYCCAFSYNTQTYVCRIVPFDNQSRYSTPATGNSEFENVVEIFPVCIVNSVRLTMPPTPQKPPPHKMNHNPPD